MSFPSCLRCRTRTHAFDHARIMHITYITIVLAPDQAVDAEIIWQTIEIGQERKQHEYGSEYSHCDQDQRIGIRRSVVGRDLVPEGVEPEPRLPRVVAGFVHHPPLGTQQRDVSANAPRVKQAAFRPDG